LNSRDIEQWDVDILPQKKWFDFNLKQIWEYRDLLFLFVKRDIISFYKQTIFGPIWFIVQPILTTIIYTFIFGNLAEISTDGIPKPLFYLIGITSWTYFSETFIKTSTIFRDNAAIFGKVYFPRVISPLSIAASNLIKFLIQFLIIIFLIIFYCIKGYHFNIDYHLIYLPIFILLMAIQGLGFGMIITALTTKYRDLVFLVTFGVQLMMYTTTVIYPLSTVKGNMYWIIALNPMTFIIEGIKYTISGYGIFSFYTFMYSILVSFLIFIAGYIIFNKVEKTFIDTI
jgi:lipopolysaccharide transport system permease protein